MGALKWMFTQIKSSPSLDERLKVIMLDGTTLQADLQWEEDG